MPPSLAEVVAHPVFLSFLATATSWRERLQLQDVFYRVLRALNYTDHNLAVVCSINKVAAQFSKLVKKAPFNKKSFAFFLEKKHEWLASTVFPEDCCQVAVKKEQQEQEVLLEHRGLLRRALVRLQPDMQRPAQHERLHLPAHLGPGLRQEGR